MAKIFEWDARKGSFIDGISKTVMPPTKVTFNRSSKGYICNFNGSSGKIMSDISVGSKSIRTVCVWAKSRTTRNNNNFFTIGNETSTNRFQFGYSINPNIVCAYNGTSIIQLTPSPEINKLHCFIFLISDTQVKTIIDNVDYGWVNAVFNDFYSTFFNIGTNSTGQFYYDGGILKISLHSNMFGTEELNREYREFLQSQPTEKPIRGFELVKPTDLSYLKDRGLLAAYNFKRNGDTLVDISGNGYNFTIEPGTVERDNGLYFPMTRATITSSITLPAGSKTVCWRGTIHNIPGTFARIYSSYLMFNAAFNLFYYRAANDTIITLATGFTTADLNKEFDFVYVQEGNSSQKLYINGVLMGSSTETITSNQLIGEINSTTNGGYVTHKDLRFYTRAFSEQEVKDYHNSFIKPIILEDWSGSAVGDVIWV